MAMVAVKGLYQGGETVTIDVNSLSPIDEPYEVVVTFLRPAKAVQEYEDKGVNQNPDKRQVGFQTFMKYKGSLPPGFDYRKELADYREERYGHIN